MFKILFYKILNIDQHLFLINLCIILFSLPCSDLYGALGHSVKLSKTVIKGQKKDVVLRFLKVLSYFIRCSDICEQLFERIEVSDTDSLDNRYL